MKPRNLLVFLLVCTSSFLALGLLFPEGIPLGGWKISFYKFPTIGPESTGAVKPELNPKKLEQLQKQAEILVASEADSTQEILIGEESSPADGFSVSGPDFHIDSSSALQYPAGDSTILEPFFGRLDSARQKGELIRILHIGDSQIEGDRISGYLRQRLQQRFGGCGPGLIPLAEEIPSRLYLKMSSLEKTRKYQLLGTGPRGTHSQYSVMHSYLRLRPDSGESGFCRKNFSFRLNGLGYKRNNSFDRATLIFRNSREPLSIETGGENRRFAPSDSLRFSKWNFKSAGRQLNLSVSTGNQSDLYGICLDCRSGVALDNIPLRGSSGLELLKIKPAFLQEQIRRLNTGLVILQFGVNVVPYEAASYGWYENNLVKIIQLIKRSSPGLQVLVIGVSDMARKKDGEWGSFETIPRVIEAQKRACARTNSAFWDMQQVMGGKNAILAWSKTNPPLAGKDMIHLTPKGAQVVGEFLFRALKHEIRKS